MLSLSVGNGIKKSLINQRMLQFAIDSARDDGVENLVIMIGVPGFIGESDVSLEYLEDGYIRLYGSNEEDYDGWMKLSEFVLEPGTYTLTGLKRQAENTVALQLRLEDSNGYYCYIYQYDDDSMFTIKREMKAILHVRVYPGIKDIDMTARPAVYKEIIDGKQ